MSFVKLPKRRERPRSGIARVAQREWPQHRRYIRTLECAVPGCSEVRWPPVALTAVVECCHVRLGTDGGGSLKPSDWWTYPGCSVHHAESHRIGEASFQAKYKIDLRSIALGLARQSPDLEMRKAMREIEGA